jgi:hypothetical protein
MASLRAHTRNSAACSCRSLWHSFQSEVRGSLCLLALVFDPQDAVNMFVRNVKFDLTTRRHIQEVSTLHSSRYKNLIPKEYRLNSPVR